MVWFPSRYAVMGALFGLEILLYVTTLNAKLCSRACTARGHNMFIEAVLTQHPFMPDTVAIAKGKIPAPFNPFP